MIKNIKEEYKKFSERKIFSRPSREPFFELAVKHIPENLEGYIVDIGAGNGSFIDSTNIKFAPSEKVYLLDSNDETISFLQKKFSEFNVIDYVLPNKLPFEDGSVKFVHLSHIIEHLKPKDLHVALNELDRVVSVGGVIAISTPLLWDRFWDDLSHVRPYSPAVLRNYLVNGRDNATGKIISRSYEEIDFTYRYRSQPIVELSSIYFIFYLLLKFINVSLLFLGFRRYIKNGYTIILKKTKIDV